MTTFNSCPTFYSVFHSLSLAPLSFYLCVKNIFYKTKILNKDFDLSSSFKPCSSGEILSCFFCVCYTVALPELNCCVIFFASEAFIPPSSSSSSSRDKTRLFRSRWLQPCRPPPFQTPTVHQGAAWASNTSSSQSLCTHTIHAHSPGPFHAADSLRLLL